MAQRNFVTSKHYYRRWFLGLALSPAYRFFHEKNKVSRYRRFNTTASYFDFKYVLEYGFDAWWEKNQIRLQSAIPTDYLKNLQLPYSYTASELNRVISEKKAEYENQLNEEDLQLDTLTILDNSSGSDHKEIDFIDKILGARVIKFIKETSGGADEYQHQGEYQLLKLKNIYDLIEPSIENANEEKTININRLENRVSEWNTDFFRIFWYAQLGYFYYDSDTEGKAGKAKERKFLELKTPSYSPKADLYTLHANLFSVEHKDDFLKFIDPSNKEFFSIEKLIQILSAFCPETLDHSQRELVNQLPSPAKIIKQRQTLLKFPDDNHFVSFEKCKMWTEMEPHLEPLFSSDIYLKFSSGYKIAEVFLDHTEDTDTVHSINPIKLQIISCLLPFLFQDDEKISKKKPGSLNLLWKKRPNLFIATDNMFFGITILIRNGERKNEASCN